MKSVYCYKIVKAEFNSTSNNYGPSAVHTSSFENQNEKVERGKQRCKNCYKKNVLNNF